MTAQVQRLQKAREDFDKRVGVPVDAGEDRQAEVAGAGKDDADRVAFEIEELIRENRWKEIADRYYPLEQKLPDIVSQKRDVRIRAKLAFALGHLKKFDEAIAESAVCVERFPDNFMYQASLAYNAYNALWAAKNREILLSGEARRERVELAHRHFKKAQELRPGGSTNFYREGMLYYRLEDKPKEALPLFLRAVKNWEALTTGQQEERAQERKNYVKALYQAASVMILTQNPSGALENIEKCLAEDERSGYMERLFKFFALGKVRYHLGDYQKARDALKFALVSRRHNQPADFVHELLARTYLALGDLDRAEKSVGEVPEKRRRPYIRWTEADILCAQNRADDARKVLLHCAEKDRMSRHKALIRLAKLEYREGFFERCEKCASAADSFFRERWGAPYIEGCFWRALAFLEAGDRKKAEKLARTMEKHYPRARRLQQLSEALEAKAAPETQPAAEAQQKNSEDENEHETASR